MATLDDPNTTVSRELIWTLTVEEIPDPVITIPQSSYIGPATTNNDTSIIRFFGPYQYFYIYDEPGLYEFTYTIEDAEVPSRSIPEFIKFDPEKKSFIVDRGAKVGVYKIRIIATLNDRARTRDNS